ncbi:MAG TPA: peptidase C39 family protein [Roseiflexaceae bacterium]|nr:peptidase C39 family protein [Roseiflexaceae bacterium]
MPRLRMFGWWTLILLGCCVSATPAAAKNAAYQTGFTAWHAAQGEFAGWQRTGVNLAADGALTLDPALAQSGSDAAGGYYGHNFYNGGSYLVGQALSPVFDTPFGFTEAIASWNASTPPGTWIETQISVNLGGRWTKFYNLGVWAADSATVERHSVNQQGDADGYVAVDTLVLTAKKASGSAFQLKVRLFSADGSAVPSLRNLSVAFSTTPGKPGTLPPGDPALWNRVLAVPECSQMVYSDGGEVWCSPTSTSMVLGYWEHDSGPCEPRVRAAVAGVYDWLYDGHGNWPFNTAYAATHGMEAYVARFTSLAQAEPWIAAGVPVVISYPWKKSDLTGAPIPSSNGHLAVIVGFDAAGNPIVNDPAAANDADVQRTYLRSELEPLWLENSGGTVYLIYPAGWPAPALS